MCWLVVTTVGSLRAVLQPLPLPPFLRFALSFQAVTKDDFGIPNMYSTSSRDYGAFERDPRLRPVRGRPQTSPGRARDTLRGPRYVLFPPCVTYAGMRWWGSLAADDLDLAHKPPVVISNNPPAIPPPHSPVLHVAMRTTRLRRATCG